MKVYSLDGIKMPIWLSVILVFISLIIFFIFILILDSVKMPTWLFVTLVVIVLIMFLIFIVWLDWKSKCRKTIKENKMITFVDGYAILGDDSVESNVCMLSGLLGVNSEELVFEHRFKDDAAYFRHKISDVSSIEILKYDESSFLRLIQECCDIHGDTVRYAVINMGGISTSNRIPELVQSRMLCKISVKGKGFLFCLKDTVKNVEILKKIKSYICPK